MKRYPAVRLQVRQMSQEEQEESDALPVKFLLGQDSIDNCNEGGVIGTVEYVSVRRWSTSYS
jgi:hypothetical protein